MRARKLTLPAPKPRNPVLAAVAKRLATMAGGRHRAGVRRKQQFERLELDQRVRESGEW
ncbi:MAG: short-chain dehydrogenase [Burkholderiaceae bacterium]